MAKNVLKTRRLFYENFKTSEQIVLSGGICFLLFIHLVLNCNSSSSYKSDDNSYLLYLLAYLNTPSTYGDLPQPEINTATMILGGTTFTKTLGHCKADLNGISIPNSDLSLPSFYIHDVDFSLNYGVTVKAAGSFILNIDQVGGGGYDPISPCDAKIMENSTTIYDIQVKDCALDKILSNPTPPTNTVSFRARCTKGL